MTAVTHTFHHFITLTFRAKSKLWLIVSLVVFRSIVHTIMLLFISNGGGQCFVLVWFFFLKNVRRQTMISIESGEKRLLTTNFEILSIPVAEMLLLNGVCYTGRVAKRDHCVTTATITMMMTIIIIIIVLQREFTAAGGPYPRGPAESTCCTTAVKNRRVR